MQVKKFEARTMKEALEMVKKQLGPEAIILSARDNQKSFGLVGEGSVEITAAISEETLRKKQVAEAKLREIDREKLNASSAKTQRAYIEKATKSYLQKPSAPDFDRPKTSQRYIDIIDDEDLLPPPPPSGSARERIKNAASMAWSAMQEQDTFEPGQKIKIQKPTSLIVPTVGVTTNPPIATSQTTPEVNVLKNEIESLKQVIQQFQSVPQNMTQGHPGAQYGIPYDLSFMYEKLHNAGIDAIISAEIVTKAMKAIPPLKHQNKSLVDGWVARYLLETTLVASNPTEGKIHCFVGSAGSGKTSSLVKMASHLVVREGKKVALITTDTFKVGAADQMKIFAQILNVPFSIVRNAGDWDVIARYLSNVDCILVDFPGLSLKSPQEIAMLQKLIPPESLNPKIHLVLSALAKDQDITELARRYAILEYQDAIFSSLDESAVHGSIYNFMKRFNVPLHSFGIGPKVPEDFEYASKERVLDLIYKLTRVETERAVAV